MTRRSCSWSQAQPLVVSAKNSTIVSHAVKRPDVCPVMLRNLDLPMKKMCRVFTALIVAQLALPAMAAPQFVEDWASGTELRWQFSPLTYHFSQDPEHKPVVMVGLEREHPDASIDGLALFTNSFGQPTAYWYPWGHSYKDIFGVAGLSIKWTAGLLYGYRAPYESKVPLNFRGLSPAAIPALVYEIKPGYSAQVNFLGTAGLMFQFSMPFE